MPVSAAALQRQELQELQERLDRAESELRDWDWLERLEANADFKKLVAMYDKVTAEHQEKLTEMHSQMVSKPMGVEATMALKQQMMILDRDCKTRSDILSFPRRELKRLEQIRQALPAEKARLAELTRGE